MNNESLKILLQKLDDRCGLSLEQAVAFANNRGHAQVGLEHLVLKLVESEDHGALEVLLDGFSVDKDQLWYDLISAINNYRVGFKSKPSISLQLGEVLEKACGIGALHYDHFCITSGLILEAIVELGAHNPEYGAFQTLMNINLSKLRPIHSNLLTQKARSGFASGDNKETPLESQSAENSALAQFTTNLTQQAEEGLLDNITGRTEEVRSTIDILCRRRKNNPILVGEPGVGKTAIVEGLALKIAAKAVPEQLKGMQICVLDLGLLQAGAGVKGEFERRLKQIVDEVKQAKQPVMLFIDEAHTLVGAGGDAGLGDAANLLKPALARGELRTIAATTFSEYKQYFERDPALARRFQKVRVDEPSSEAAMLMLSNLKKGYQEHHAVFITDAAIEAAVSLSQRYITGRYLPDKAIDLLDTAAARITMSQRVQPSIIEALTERRHYIDARLEQIKNEEQNGIEQPKEIVQLLEAEHYKCKADLDAAVEQWQKEQTLVSAILNKTTEQEPLTSDKAALRSQLNGIQHEKPMVLAEVNELAIADVVADWTGIPVGRMSKDDNQAVLSFESNIEAQVVGQSQAIHSIGQSLRCAKAGLSLTEGPVGCFLLTGPSGVGKTQTAQAIAEQLFGSEQALITINMSEYQEAHSVSQLKGSPPGYVGYGEGGLLTEAIRNRPYSVLLLDEVEKAHPDVLNMFYQVFDKGIMRDGEGRMIDFSHCLILMTSNLGSEEIQHRFEKPEVTELAVANEVERTVECHWQEPTLSELEALIKPNLQAHFAPALLARMKVIPFNALQSNELSLIVKLKLDKLAQRLQEQYSIEFRVSDAVVDVLVSQCGLSSAGARFINQLLERNLMPNIAASLLQYLADDALPDILTLAIENGELSCVFSDRIESPIEQSA